VSVSRIIDEKTVTLEDDERQECEVWTRVMGYYRPVSEFNIGKKQEHEDRRFFSEKKAVSRAKEDGNSKRKGGGTC
jgi:hypothetical protein